MKKSKDLTIATRITDNEKLAFEIWAKKNNTTSSKELRRHIVEMIGTLDINEILENTQNISIKINNRKRK